MLVLHSIAAKYHLIVMEFRGGYMLFETSSLPKVIKWYTFYTNNTRQANNLSACNFQM